MLISNYKSFISEFIQHKYKFIYYDELNNNKSNQVILRHDVDLDIDLAYEMSIIENSIGIKSTYFFLLSNNSYNLISEKNKKILIKIRDLGHKISLHFDMTIYEDILEGFRKEQEIFNKIFNEKINIISIHRPKNDFLKSPDNFFNISNSYESKYTDNISYFADSGGSFRYGNPLNSISFKNKQNIQLVIHPAWWMINLNSVNEIVDEVIKNKSEKIRSHFEKSIKTYKPNS